MSQLSAHSLGLWRGERCLCRDLSFRVDGGAALQLAGANGSGKTSLIRALAGIGRVDEGEVRWNGTSLRASDYRRHCAYLGHHNGLKAHLTPLENYRFHQSLAAQPSDLPAEEALHRFGLRHVQHQPAGLLSMGQKRRAALTRLLAVRAELWLLDEPLTSLDVEGVALVTGILRGHLAGGGLAVLATHQAMPVEGLPLARLELAEMQG